LSVGAPLGHAAFPAKTDPPDCPLVLEAPFLAAKTGL